MAMKITLDLSGLVARGRLTPEEAERLRGLAAEDTGALGINLLLGFGTVAVALGIGALLPDPVTAIVLGGVLFALGLWLSLGQGPRWGLLAQICLVIGALALAGGAVIHFDGSLAVELALTVGLAVAAVAARSGLLAALAVLMATTALGAGTAYFHAVYAFWSPHPALTIGALSALTLALYLLSLRLAHPYERLAIIAARTAILVVNLAFLVGSLFGDDDLHWPDTVFVVAWALALGGVGAWAVKENRRWVVNSVAVFAALHFYTQWFERLGASAISILGGGFLLIGFGMLLRSFNRPKAEPPAAAS
jgi:iron complex transport system permease protein